MLLHIKQARLTFCQAPHFKFCCYGILLTQHERSNLRPNTATPWFISGSVPDYLWLNCWQEILLWILGLLTFLVPFILVWCVLNSVSQHGILIDVKCITKWTHTSCADVSADFYSQMEAQGGFHSSVLYVCFKNYSSLFNIIDNSSLVPSVEDNNPKSCCW